jgi:hypothetical protein
VDKKKAREGSEKMSKAIRANNLGARVAVVLICALLLLGAAAFVWQQAATTSEPDVRATSAEGDRGSGITNNPAIARHAEVVAAYRGVSPDKSSATEDPYIDRHAELIARHNRGTTR